MKTTLRILLVEDSEDDAFLILHQIQKGGYETESERVETAGQFKAALKEKAWDIILSDYKMPHFNGFEAFTLLKELGIDLPFIIVSGTIGEEVAVEAMKSGAHDYLMKNNLQRLLPVIERELRESKERAEKRLIEQKQKRTEAALRDSEARYRLLFEVSADGILIVDVETKFFKYANPALCRMLGYTEKDLTTLGLADIHPKQDLPRVIAEFESLARGDKTLAPDIPCIRKDGNIVYADINSAMITIDGRPCAVGLFRDITERKRMEEALLRINRAVESSSEAISMSDPQGHHFYNNKAFTKIFGYTAKELKTAGGGHLIYANKDVARKVFDTIMGGVSWNGEVEMLSKSGRKFTVLLRADAIKDENGKIVGLVGIHTDMTERKRAEAALRESEAKTKIILEAISTGIMIIDPETHTIVDVNSEAIRLIGEPKEKIVSSVCHQFICPAEKGKCPVTDFGQMMDNSERVLINKDGKSIPILKTVRQINWGGRALLLENFTDITDRKQTEEALQKSELRFKQISENSQESIWEVDRNGLYTYISPVVKELLGYEAEEIIGTKYFYDSFDPENKKEMKQAALGVFARKESFRNFVNCNIHKDGRKIILSTSGVPILDKGNSLIGYRGVDVDITERKQVEEEISLKNEQLLKLNTEKDKFFSIIAHDMRGPFGGFLGLTQIMAEDLPSLTMAEIQDIALRMRNSANNLFLLLENLLEWAKMQQGLIPFNPELIQLLPFVDKCIVIMQEPAKTKGIEITCDIPDSLTVFADNNILKTVIRNLVSNALKFTPKGGKVSLSAIDTGNKSVEISISDTGIGMSSKIVDNLFRLDVKTCRKGTEGEPSSGLGLLLCKEFVEKHGGKIWAKSEVEKGTTIFFTIP